VPTTKATFKTKIEVHGAMTLRPSTRETAQTRDRD
jgi:hypothetical protein